MEKRLFLAIALSSAILLLWSLVGPKPPLPKPAQLKAPARSPTTILPTEVQPELPASQLLTYPQSKYELTFITNQAALKEIQFKDYKAYKFPLKYGFMLLDKNLNFQAEKISAQEVIFSHQDENKKIKKDFIFSKSNYIIELEITVQNESANKAMQFDYPLILGVLDWTVPQEQARFQDVTVALAEKTLHLTGRKDAVFAQPKFIAWRDRYFCSIVEPASGNYTALLRKNPNGETEITLVPTAIMLEPGKTWQQKFRIYLGPQDLHLIKSVNPAWQAVVHYGFFDFISRILLQLLELLYRIVHNWGWAIIILSLVIYLFLFPLSLKQMRSMKQMQALQPRIEELRKLYKDNPQKLHKETLELYRQHKVNPFGGCLPLLLQMPIFFALYQALIRSIALKGASFFWIKDLSEPDRLFRFTKHLPVIGNEFNLLPILMALIMFWQQKISLAPGKTEQAQQQKMMLIMMPLMFGWIFYHMPAGLVLYWLVNSVLMVANQLSLSRLR